MRKAKLLTNHWDARIPHIGFYATRDIQPGEELTCVSPARHVLSCLMQQRSKLLPLLGVGHGKLPLPVWRILQSTECATAPMCRHLLVPDECLQTCERTLRILRVSSTAHADTKTASSGYESL